MKKKVDKNVLSESCYMMNISKTLTTIEGNSISSKVSDENKLALQNPLTPPQSVINSPNSKVKTERENSPNSTEFGEDNNHGKSSPPLSSLGPGAEIKGKICHPIPSSSKLEESEILDDANKATNLGPLGGRLTFFREGKLLLELSHRSEQGSWVQVKSKTYWPPPSTTTTTSSIQHPLRHDTPTTHSDDCSSINSSPWLSDHIRKQSVPNSKNKIWITNDHSFYLKITPLVKSLRHKVRLRRKSYAKLIVPINNFIGHVNSLSEQESLEYCRSIVKDIKFSERKKILENKISHLGKQIDLKLDENLSIRTLFDGRENSSSSCSSSESIDPTFVTPRKRYLRALEADLDANSRKKVHSGMSPASLHLKHCDRLPSPFLHGPHKSAIISQNSSSYSIDSLLSNESDKKNESFLRNLLRSDKPRHSSQTKQSACKDRNVGLLDGSNHMKMERGASPYPKERKEFTNDHKKVVPERFDLSHDLSRFSAHSNLSSLYLNPYLDPRYMMFPSLSSVPPFLPTVSQSSEMASAVAVAAAAAAGYSLNPLHISTLTANSLLPGGLGGSAYAPATSLASQLIRSPNTNRSSPLSVPHSPSPKLSPALPAIPISSHFGIPGSPRDLWTSSTLQNSPHKYPSTSSVSPPPQEVPLNLTKPKRK